ncbi:MAG: hypothetical protein M3066_14150 [Actinomycetota bacterium]|nr:hypothetical protein [Actinomycetota bacterium]
MHKLTTMTAMIMTTLFVVAAPADARPAHNEHFTIIFTGAPGSPGTVHAAGVISGRGTITPNEDDESGLDTLVLPDGTITLVSTTTTSVQTPTQPVCITRFSSTGTFDIVGGTGAYSGLGGHGTVNDHGLTRSLNGPEGCSDTPIAVHAVLHLEGTVTGSQVDR